MKTLKEKEYKLFNENGFRTKVVKNLIKEFKKRINKLGIYTDIGNIKIIGVDLVFYELNKLTGNLE